MSLNSKNGKSEVDSKILISVLPPLPSLEKATSIFSPSRRKHNSAVESDSGGNQIKTLQE